LNFADDIATKKIDGRRCLWPSEDKCEASRGGGNNGFGGLAKLTDKLRQVSAGPLVRSLRADSRFS
jgi:hypothetical protein